MDILIKNNRDGQKMEILLKTKKEGGLSALSFGTAVQVWHKLHIVLVDVRRGDIENRSKRGRGGGRGGRGRRCRVWWGGGGRGGGRAGGGKGGVVHRRRRGGRGGGVGGEGVWVEFRRIQAKIVEVGERRGERVHAFGGGDHSRERVGGIVVGRVEPRGGGARGGRRSGMEGREFERG